MLIAMEMSDQQIVTQLWELENSEEADRRAELTGGQFLSLFKEKLNDRSHVFRHGVDETGGLDVGDAEFWEYDTGDEAERVFTQLLNQAARRGGLVDPDSDSEMGDIETAGADLRGTSSDTTDSLAVEDPTEPEVQPERGLDGER
jgi:hypothetical protein